MKQHGAFHGSIRGILIGNARGTGGEGTALLPLQRIQSKKLHLHPRNCLVPVIMTARAVTVTDIYADVKTARR